MNIAIYSAFYSKTSITYIKSVIDYLEENKHGFILVDRLKKHLGSEASKYNYYKDDKPLNQKIDFVFFLNVNKETIIKRIEQRKSIENRSDDDLNTIVKRYDKYMETTKPVLDYYAGNSNFNEIDGTLEIDQITAKIDTFLNV